MFLDEESGKRHSGLVVSGSGSLRSWGDGDTEGRDGPAARLEERRLKAEPGGGAGRTG